QIFRIRPTLRIRWNWGGKSRISGLRFFGRPCCPIGPPPPFFRSLTALQRIASLLSLVRLSSPPAAPATRRPGLSPARAWAPELQGQRFRGRPRRPPE